MVKKAQIKIQQMAFMLIAITLFFALVGLFALMFALSGIKDSATKLEEQNAIFLVTRLANSPEFSCGDVFDNSGTNCVDADKVMALKEKIDYYRDFWGVANLEIIKIYPPFMSEQICTASNYPNCNTIRLLDSEVRGKYYSSFIALCRKQSIQGEIYDKCELARLMVSYEDK